MPLKYPEGDFEFVFGVVKMGDYKCSSSSPAIFYIL